MLAIFLNRNSMERARSFIRASFMMVTGWKAKDKEKGDSILRTSAIVFKVRLD